jgi:hypothetical protein
LGAAGNGKSEQADGGHHANPGTVSHAGSLFTSHQSQLAQLAAMTKQPIQQAPMSFPALDLIAASLKAPLAS